VCGMRVPGAMLALRHQSTPPPTTTAVAPRGSRRPASPARVRIGAPREIANRSAGAQSDRIPPFEAGSRAAEPRESPHGYPAISGIISWYFPLRSHAPASACSLVNSSEKNGFCAVRLKRRASLFSLWRKRSSEHFRDLPLEAPCCRDCCLASPASGRSDTGGLNRALRPEPRE
jgi:hypothetical protein